MYFLHYYRLNECTQDNYNYIVATQDYLKSMVIVKAIFYYISAIQLFQLQ